MKRILVLLSVAFLLVAGYQVEAWALGLNLDKAVYAPGENITVQFTAPAEFAPDAWVGIIPAAVAHGSESQNDEHDLAYQYLERRTGGTLVFQAPNAPGAYDVRLHTTDQNGQEVASVTFTVIGGGAPPAAASLRLDKAVSAPGESLKVQFVAPAGLPRDAWVGVIPAEVPHGSESQNDNYDLAYQYLEGRTEGTLVFAAPAKPGKYDFRLNSSDNNGQELASVTFEVR
ncbi:MAG: hypothetical protein AB1896_07815 [Thermodesulfobacteriota bacterium]